MSKEIRMQKIFGEDGKAIVAAMDAFGFSMHTDGVDHAMSNIEKMAEHGLDCALVTYGQAQTYAKELRSVTTVLRVDGGTNNFDTTIPGTSLYFDIEDAVKLGTDGVVLMTFPGAGEREELTHQMLAQLAKQGNQWNVPIIAETLPFGYAVTSEDSNDPKYIAAAARMGTEFGADIIKTRFSGTEADKEIVERADRPILVLGGPKTDTLSYFKFVKHCMDCGAKGVAVGRNVTQDKNPIGMVAGLNKIIHEDGTPEEALEVYNTVQ